MSKKMMKRSLALGALMAFVITGSAMAAEEMTGGALEKTLKGGEYKVTAGDVTLSQGDGYQHIAGASGGNSILVENAQIYVDEGKTLTINSSEPGTGTWGAIKNTTITGNGMVKIASTNNAAALGYYSKDSITAKDIELKGTKYGVYGSDGTEHTLVADNINIESTGRTVFAGLESKVEITANEKLTVTSTEKKVALTTNGDGNINVSAKDILLNGGIETLDVSKVTLNASNDITVNGNVTANKSTASVLAKGINTINGSVIAGYEVSSGKTEINLSGNEINVDAKNGFGVVAWSAYYADDAKVAINLNAGEDGKVNIKNASYGLMAYGNGATVDVKAAQLNIKDSTYGMWVANRSVSSGDNLDGGDRADDAKVVIGADTDVNITNVEVGIVSMSQGTVDIAGNLEIKASETAIDTRGEAMTLINKANDSTKTVKIDGDIVFDYDDYKVDSGIVINLANEGSYLKGNIYNTGAGIIPDGVVTGMVIGLSNGAQWELSEASVVNEASFGNNSVLIIKDGSVFEAEKDDKGNVTTNGVYALNAAGGDSNKLSIDNTAKLQIGGIQETTYNIAQGFANYDKVAEKIDIADNALLQANKKVTGEYYQVEIKAKEAEQMATEMGVSSSTAQSLANVTAAAQAAQKANVTADKEGTGSAKAVALVEAIADAPSDVAGQAYEAVSKMAEAGGNSGTAASIVKNVTGVTNDRLSFNCGHSAPQKGGHGVGLFEEGSGADVWVEYVHGKDKVEDMPSTAGATSYEGQFNGIVMGVDFKKVNKFQSGVAFNYGEGDTNSVGSVARTHSDYDFWGVGYYGNIHNDDSNVIFDIGYAKTESDVESNVLGLNYKASPETTTWTAGVKLEKLYQNENVQIVPYTGLRFMSIDPEDYTTECASNKYQMERQNIWMVPVGVSIKQEVTNDNGWTVSPRVDLSYIWAFGDTDSEMEFSTLGTKTNIGYEVMDDGSFLGLVGIEAHKGQWGYGISYSYQKGDHSESKKWFVDVNYSF